MKNIFGLFLVLVVCALPAAAQTWEWSEPGSTGVIDDGTTGLYTQVGAYLAVAPTAIATIEARYPVTNTVGSATDISPAWTTLQMAVRDQDAVGASVTATLYEVDICSSNETQLCSITSSETEDEVHCETCNFTGPLDFANHSYYVLVTIAKTATGTDPRLYELAVY